MYSPDVNVWRTRAMIPRVRSTEGRLDILLKQIADLVALGCELATVVVVAIGATMTLVRTALALPRLAQPAVKKELWVGFAGWILLALEFALAADIADTAIAPTWKEIGQLAAIAAIRTLLNFFLERDLESSAQRSSEPSNG